MKILIVSAQLPHPGRGGANVRNYYLLKALDNPSMRIALGNAGRALVEAEYSWEQAGTQLLHVLVENC